MSYQDFSEYETLFEPFEKNYRYCYLFYKEYPITIGEDLLTIQCLINEYCLSFEIFCRSKSKRVKFSLVEGVPSQKTINEALSTAYEKLTKKTTTEEIWSSVTKGQNPESWLEIQEMVDLGYFKLWEQYVQPLVSYLNENNWKAELNIPSSTIKVSSPDSIFNATIQIKFSKKTCAVNQKQTPLKLEEVDRNFRLNLKLQKNLRQFQFANKKFAFY